jgi:iron(III) transport system ATP-binding protein
VNQPYLRLTAIRKDFGSFTALNNVALDIAPGEFVCFLGPSGCGKTTLLRIVAGLEVQSAGRIELAGRDISRLPPADRDYGIVFQSYALFPNLSIADNVAYGLVNRKVPRAQVQVRVTELLALVGLPGSEARFPAQLSGGQQQRIALARALATSPGLLLLDEPLSALDAIVRVKLRSEIRSLQRKLGVTTIMVTHDQEEALSMADRVVVMNAGVIEQVGTPLQVYSQPATPFVADFIGKGTRLTAVTQADGSLRCGEMPLPRPPSLKFDLPVGAEVTLYLRPEDRVVESLTDAHPHQCVGTVGHVEFLGGNCLAEIHVDALPQQPLLLQFTLNQMHDLNVREGMVLRFALRADRLRAFMPAPH